MNYSISSNNRLFPNVKEFKKANKELLSDDVGRYSISLPKDAQIITSLIKYHIEKLKLSIDQLTITDATAGIGGNTISFSKKFKKVNSIELNKNRFSFLKNNINFYELKNINLINCDYTCVIDNLIQDVVFIDPPWGGRSYKKKKNLTLKLSNIGLDMICKKLKNLCKLVVLKLPLNYNLDELINPINANIYKHKIRKMYIIIIEF